MTTGFRLLVHLALAALFAVIFSVRVSAQVVPPQRFALLAADSSEAALDVRNTLVAAGLDVTIIDAGAGTTTPALTDLLTYDAVLTWSNLGYPYADAIALGHLLADYVDAGGGVVHGAFATIDDASLRLDGRWHAEGYAAFVPGSFRMGFGLTLVPEQPSHPILAGVATFDGGNQSLHVTASPQNCADVIAQWSNSQPLVAARSGPHGGRIVGLNFYPVSDASGNLQLWRSATDGGRLMANALGHAAASAYSANAPAIALLAADDPARVAGVGCQLHNLELFSRVDIVDVRSATPTLALLSTYDAALTWSAGAYADSTALGNLLADYLDRNGGVVQSIFQSYPEPGAHLEGRWGSSGYGPFSAAPVSSASALTLIPHDPGHVVLSGVTDFAGGDESYRSGPVSLDPTTTLVASWSDGEPFIVTGAHPSGGRIVGLNLFPAIRDTRLIANTLLFAANHAPIANAGGDQTIEATSSSGVSFILNGTASDPDGDSPLTFAWSGAGSASGPAVTVDAPPPAAPNKTQTYTVTLTVSDGKGGEDTDSIELTVRDSMGPVLSGVPSGVVTAEAAGPDGAEVSYGPVTAIDAVDGARPVECSHASAGVFPVGDTLVTCSSSDSRENGTSETFIVRVSESAAVAPGKAYGYGFVRGDRVHHEFVFAASENAAGREHGGLLLNVKSEVRGHRARITWRHDTFVARTADAVTFSAGATVLFSGVGRWNGTAGYRYEIFAVDKGRPGRGHHDAVRITITAPGGAIVAHIDADLTGGDVHLAGIGE